MRKLFTIILLAILCVNAMAYDFSAVCSTGQTLYYNITSNVEPYTVEVTSENADYPYYTTYPTGNLEIPETVEYNGITYLITGISYRAFWGCGDITSATISNTITSIGTEAFYSCGVNEPIYNSNWFAYFPCGYATEYAIPNGIQKIAGGAFVNCSELTSVTIPNSITSIGEFAFQNCSGLTGELIIQNSDTINIGPGAFLNCSRLTSVIINGSVKNIGAGAFGNCSGLTTMTINGSVENIGADAIMGCSALTTLTINGFVENIEENAFADCEGLTEPIYNDNCFIFFPCGFADEYIIPDGIQHIAGGAFYCGTYSITIPSSVISIGKSAFRSSLRTIIVDSDNEYYDSRDNCNAIIETATNKLIYGCVNTNIPNTVTSIGESAFDGCELTSISIPNSVREIEKGAFRGCEVLTSIFIPNSVTYIGETAFMARNSSRLSEIIVDSDNEYYDSRDNCNAIIETATNTLIAGCLNTIIPNTVTNIGEGVFAYCDELTSISIPDSVREIGKEAFRDCLSLTSIYIPNSVTSIGEWAFAGCGELTSATISNSITSINDYTFAYCSGLTDVSIPNCVVNIGSNAFVGCRGLSSITIGNSVENIDYYAFNDCDNIAEINMLTNIPPALGNKRVFTETTYNTATVWTKCKSTNDYRNDREWGQFTNIQGDTTVNFTITVQSQDETMGNVIGGGIFTCEDEAILTAITNEGYRFVQWDNGRTENPLQIIVTEDTSYIAYFEICNNFFSIDTTVSNFVTIGDHTFYSTGNYTFTIPSETDCDTIFDIRLRVLAEPVYDIGPNPTKSLLNINSDGFISAVEFYSVTGQLVMRKDVNGYEAEFDMEGLVDGVYILRIYGEESSLPAVSKVVKE